VFPSPPQFTAALFRQRLNPRKCFIVVLALAGGTKMHRGLKRIIVAGVACGFLGLGGCASIEDVERAQATADRAVATADRAMSTANQAQQTALNAQSSADRAMQTASAAQTAANNAVASNSQTRSDITALNQRYESAPPTRIGQRD